MGAGIVAVRVMDGHIRAHPFGHKLRLNELCQQLLVCMAEGLDEV